MNRPKLPATAVAVSLALLAPGQRGAAQSATDLDLRLEAGALTSHAGGASLGGFTLGPSVRYETARLAVGARGTAWLQDEQWRVRDAFATVEIYTPLLYGVRAEVLANASRLFYDPTLQNDQLDASGRIHYMRQRGGVWLGSGVAHPLKVAAVSNVNVSSGGVWTRLGHTTFRGSVTSFFFTKVVDTAVSALENASVPACASPAAAGPEIPGALASIVPADGSACRRESRVTDLEASVQWEHKLLEVSLRGGQRFGDRMDVTPDSRQWISGQTAVWITNQMAAVAGGGREPAHPARGLPARSYGSLGLMLAYWPIPRGTVPVATPASLVRAFEMRPAGTALQRLTARIGGVETVEVMGDFSDWAPIPLVRRGRDLWELLIPMSPGVHHINLRIDGGTWIAPPGVPAIRDGFSGEVGVLVIRQ